MYESGLRIFVDDAVYARITTGTRSRTVPVFSEEFRRIVARIAKRELGERPPTKLVKAVVDTVAELGTELNERQPIGTRYARRNGALWIDMCDTDGNVVKLDTSGWRIVHDDQCPVPFRRTAEMRSQPLPARGGSIDLLRPHVNVTGDDFTSLAGWLVGAMDPDVAVPILMLVGRQDSAKSTTTRFIAKLIDDRNGALRHLPGSAEDVFVLARAGWLQVYENVSSISRSKADAICTLVTGGAWASRRRHSDLESSVIEARRPVLINGINALLEYEDLADRSMVITLQPIRAEQRRSEARMNEAFEVARPLIFGALLDALVLVERNREAIRLADTGRMPDFQQAVASGEIAFGWAPGTFKRASDSRRREMSVDVVEASPVGSAVRAYLQQNGTFYGTPTQLNEALHAVAGASAQGGFRGIPRLPQQMMQQLNRVAPALSAIGVLVESGQKNPLGERVVRIRMATDTGSRSSASTTSESPFDVAAPSVEAFLAACKVNETDEVGSDPSMATGNRNGLELSSESDAANPLADSGRLPTYRVLVTDDAHSSDRRATPECPMKAVDEGTSLEQKTGGTL